MIDIVTMMGAGLTDAASWTAAAVVHLALADPQACMPPGMSGPVLRAFGWVKAIGLIVCGVSVVRIGMHIAKQQGDGVPDRDDTADKVFNVALAAFFVSAALSLVLGLGVSVLDACA